MYYRIQSNDRLKRLQKRLNALLLRPVHIAPLITLRVVFGAMMLFSTLRFAWKGWIYDLYIAPELHFTYYGFDWVKPLPPAGMYLIFFLTGLAALFIMTGFLYRISTLAFFITFTYTELIDSTSYLNHYYFVSIIAFLLIFVPANRYFSLDVRLRGVREQVHISVWCIFIFKLQLGIVYFYAGIAKLNYDWIVEALPLKIWLPAQSQLPIIGFLMSKKWVPYLFSWAGAAFDILIPFLLLYRRTRSVSYLILLIFHILTWTLFKIGMFPFVMMGSTLVFFSENFHKKWIGLFRKTSDKRLDSKIIPVAYIPKWTAAVLIVHFIIQFVFPFRYLAYPGNLFWTEEGFRFSWRVMLMEKGGTAFFYVTDPKTGLKEEINNREYLTEFQEKMMSTQPDMLLQFAHFLDQKYQKNGLNDPIITAKCFVSLNGKGSRLFIDPNIDLSQLNDSWQPKKWIQTYE